MSFDSTKREPCCLFCSSCVLIHLPAQAPGPNWRKKTHASPHIHTKKGRLYLPLATLSISVFGSRLVGKARWFSTCEIQFILWSSSHRIYQVIMPAIRTIVFISVRSLCLNLGDIVFFTRCELDPRP